MLSFIVNLFSILRNIPEAISIFKALIAVVGKDNVRQIIAVIRDVTQRFQADENTLIENIPPKERKRRFEKFKLRLGQDMLGLSDFQLAQTMVNCDRLQDLQNA